MRFLHTESGLGEAAAGAAQMAADEEWGDDEALDGGLRARRAARSFLMTSEATSTTTRAFGVRTTSYWWARASGCDACPRAIENKRITLPTQT